MAKFTSKTNLWDGLEPEEKETPKHEHKHKPKPVVKERKTFHVHILAYPSLISRMDSYAEMHGLSRAEVFEQAVTEFLDGK